MELDTRGGCPHIGNFGLSGIPGTYSGLETSTGEATLHSNACH